MINNRRRLGYGKNAHFQTEEVRPMENLANLVDVMLVLACALMIAIITYWKVDLSQVMNVDKDKLEELDDYNKSVETDIDSEQLESKGKVYEDPKTGELYIVVD